MQPIVETISIFVIIIIDKILFISFILNILQDFAIHIKNYKLNYIQDNLGNKDLIFINQAVSWLNNLVLLADNLVLLNEDKNLLDTFEIDDIYEFNPSSQKLWP